MTHVAHNWASITKRSSEAGFGAFPKKSATRNENNGLRCEIHFAAAYTAIVETAKALWPSETHKTAADFAAAARISTRRAEQLLQAPAPMSGDALLALFTSEKGEQFMRAAMNATPKIPSYWNHIEKQLEISDLRERLRELEGGAS